ncbi:amino acid transporter [Perkinsela sp. CCAP 1560/4]|nr:amino acid transporter [Perkinsela sp. CCAP 1560/4]|eukprot:KNH09284.1 amino acid transporter [Perkinsela sp. CCAP 1560/4]
MQDSSIEISHEKSGNSTANAMIITILCTVVGGAILALPACMHFTSLIVGQMLIVLVAGLSLLSANKLVILADFLKEDSYVKLFARIMNFTTKERIAAPLCSGNSGANSYEEENATKYRESKIMKLLIQLIIFWYTFGVGVSFIIIIADSMKPLADAWMGTQGFCSSGSFWVLVVYPLLLGFSSVEQITELKVFSLVSFLTMVYVCVMIGFRYVNASVLANSVIPASNAQLFSIGRSLFQGFPIISVAFTMHYNAPQLYYELRTPSVKLMSRCLCISMIIIILLYSQVASMGYLHFGEKSVESGGDILALYGKDDLFVNIGRLLMFLHFALGFPMVSVACRRALTLFFLGKEGNVPLLYRFMAAFFIVSSSCLLAVFSRGITEIFVFNGALFGIHIVMTIPATMYFIVFRSKMSRTEMALNFLLGFCGIFFSVVGFIVVLCEKLQSH